MIESVNTMPVNPIKIYVIESGNAVADAISTRLSHLPYTLIRAPWKMGAEVDWLSVNLCDVLLLDLFSFSEDPDQHHPEQVLDRIEPSFAQVSIPVFVLAPESTQVRFVNAPKRVQVLTGTLNEAYMLKLATGISDVTHAPTTLPQILHIEDEPVMAKLVGHVLSKYASISHAATIKEAKALIQSQNFDLVLLDLSLPDGSGLDLVAEIKKTKNAPPIVIHSSHEVSDNIYNVEAVFAKGHTTEKAFVTTIQRFLKFNPVEKNAQPA